MSSSPAFFPLPPEVLAGSRGGRGSFVLLDTARPSAGNHRSYLFLSPIAQICARRYEDVARVLRRVDTAAKRYWLAGYVSYEAAYALEERLARLRDTRAPSGLPLVWFGVFERPCIFDHTHGTWDWNPPLWQPVRSAAWRRPQLRPRITRAKFGRTIGAIRRLIASGDTYQVNFTYDITVRSTLSPLKLYRQLRQGQPASYCAFIRHGHGHVASFSPELFFLKCGRRIVVKPMKGTAARGRFTEEDSAVARRLAADPKNRAENVMIVDLLRNDLGRICTYSSVRVHRLFEIETHPTLHQMTSRVEGRLRTGVGFCDIIRNIFPSGSVTGAPKIRTMEIIKRLEKGNRGVYTGMLGFISPRGDAEFSVPIRTLQKPRESRDWRYRVGSGIVWDSRAGGEWDECATKCSFLVKPPLRFDLLETMLMRRGRTVYIADHLRRMQASAIHYGFPFVKSEARTLLRSIARSWASHAAVRLRLLLSPDGALRCETHPFNAALAPPSRALRIGRARLDETEPLLYHKTTFRPWYDEAMKMARSGACYDVVFSNSRGQVAECSMNNIFMEKDGRLFTPPVHCGLLPGILRRRLLARGACAEKILSIHDLHKADAVYCGNSVRGLVKVTLA